jgi:hypothetical protein
MKRPRGRPFQPGNSFGRGRPTGSPNKPKVAGLRLLEEYADHLIRTCLAMALDGDRSCMRLCMERIIPLRRDPPIEINLPAIHVAEDLSRMAEKVTQGIRRGKITPQEGETMMRILESRIRVMESVEYVKRMQLFRPL